MNIFNSRVFTDNSRSYKHFRTIDPYVSAFQVNGSDISFDLSGPAPSKISFNSVRSGHGRHLNCFQGKNYLWGTHGINAFLNENGDLNTQVLKPDFIDNHIKLLTSIGQTSFNIPLIARSDGRYFASTENLILDSIKVVGGSCFYATPIEFANWGCWLLYATTNVYQYLESYKGLPFVCNAKMKWQIDFLVSLGVDRELIIIQEALKTYQFSDVFIHQYDQYDLVPTLSDFRYFDRVKVSLGINGVGVDNFKKIYITRSPSSARKLINESALSEGLARFGFVTIDPEKLSFAHQVAIFQAADTIVGLGGVGLFNSIFSRRGTKILSLEGIQNFGAEHASLFSRLGLDYGIVYGNPLNVDGNSNIHKDWTLNTDAFFDIYSNFLR